MARSRMTTWAERELLFGVSVDAFLERVSGERLRLPGDFGGVVGRLVHAAQRCQKGLVLRLRREQLDHDAEPHIVFTMLKSILQKGVFPMPEVRVRRLLPRPKRRGILGGPR